MQPDLSTESEINGRIAEARAEIDLLRSEVGRAVVGQDHVVNRLLIALLVRGHILLEGLPGLAKTLVAKSLAAAIEGSFRRIQFTPDLLPADITGTLIFEPASGTFKPRLGPVFANFLLADEINRAPAKVQSALLEAMQERQVTIGDTTRALPDPFVVIATQNPIEQEGTYTLPEAQVDRFLMKVMVGYPSIAEESRMLALYLDPSGPATPVRRVSSIDSMQRYAKIVSGIYLDERISKYIVSLVTATRTVGAHSSQAAPDLAFGASPRATLALAHAAKALAFLEGRAFVIPDDVKALAPDVLRHRLILTYEAAAEQISTDDVVTKLLRTVPVP